MTTKPKVEPAVEPDTMSADAALAVLTQAAHEYKGTRADHLMIDRAVQVLAAQLAPKNGSAP